jgi:hypothetical protein
MPAGFGLAMQYKISVFNPFVGTVQSDREQFPDYRFLSRFVAARCHLVA